MKILFDTLGGLNETLNDKTALMLVLLLLLFFILAAYIYKKANKIRTPFCHKCGSDLVVDDEIGEFVCPKGHKLY